MSIEARDWAYKQPITAPMKPVLLALAECADERGGSCWPSLSKLAYMTGLSTASVKRALQQLDGNLIIRKRSKGGRSSSYVLLLDKLAHSEPAQREPVENELAQGELVTGSESTSQLAQSDPELAQSEPLTVSNRPKPSIPSKKEGKPPRRIELPPWLPPDLWDEFLEHRIKLKSPMTDLAQKRAINAVSKLRDQGHDPDEVIGQSVMNGWKGLFPVKNNQAMKQDKFAASVAALNLIFGEDNGQGDFSAGDGIHGSGVFGGDQAGESRRLLGPTRRSTW